MRAVRAAVAGGLLLAGTGSVLAPTQAAAPAAAVPCSPTGSTSSVGVFWQASMPKFTAGPAAVTHVAAPAYAPDLIYATNGVQVVRSTDDGCSWKVVLDATRQAAKGPAPTIVSLRAPSSANGSRYVYVGAQADIAVVSQPTVWISPDRGESWTAGNESDGLPLVGAVRAMTASPRLPQVGYALVSDSVAGQQLRGTVWATTDGGATWVQRTPTAQSFDASSLQAGPLGENQLLALSGGTLVSSGDGGASFHSAGLDATDVTSFDQAGGGGGIRLVAGHSGSKTVSRSDDGGSTWMKVKTPVIAEQVAMGPLQEAVAVSGRTQTWLLVNPFVSDDLTTPGAQPRELQLSAPSAVGFALTGVHDGAVVRATIALDGTPLLGRVRLLPFDPLHQFPSTLTPVHTRVELPPGGTTRIPYTLLLPRTPSPLDVMFLIDTTGSMGGVIDGLRQGIAGIVSALNGSGLDVRIGLGDFKDYAAPYGGGSEGDYPYRLDRRIGVADESLRKAIEGLSAYGGGDGQESALTALVEAATGHGETVQGIQFVKPGGQAGYRKRTLRLDVISTDVAVRKRDGGQEQYGKLAKELGYTIPETVRTLNKADVHAVGLAAGQGAEPDLRMLAEGTRTLAPEGGVDCNGDGTRDVRAGAPLVCSLGDAGTSASAGGGGIGVGVGTGTGGGGTVNLAGAVIGLAEALPDRQRVSVAVTHGATYADLVGKTVRNQVNLKADNEFGYALQLSCPTRSGAGSHAIELAARAATRQVATASVELVCGAVPGRPAVVAAAGLLDPPQVDPKGAPAPPGQPPQAPNPNPNPNPNANPNMNPNVNANLGAASQEQQTQQLALVHSDVAGQASEELAMSRPTPAVPPGLLVGTAGLMFVVACGFAVRTRLAEAHDTG